MILNFPAEFVIYSPSSCFKPVCISFFCRTQNNILNNWLPISKHQQKHNNFVQQKKFTQVWNNPSIH